MILVTSQLLGLLGPCPECGNGRLRTVSTQEATNVLCEQCGRCWKVGVDCVHPVDVATCPGCELRPTCVEREATRGTLVRIVNPGLG